LLRKYNEMLDREDINASMLSEVGKFLQSNACTAKDFLNLTELENMRFDKEKTPARSDKLVNPEIPGDANALPAELQAELASYPKEWDHPSEDYSIPLKD
jgi:hypothetical protein